MEYPNRATEISLEHFPPYRLPEGGVDKTEHVAKYLQTMFKKNLAPSVDEAYLPSLCQMAIFFHCSELKAYDAFLSLRKQGFDFALEGLTNAIRIWRKYS